MPTIEATFRNGTFTPLTSVCIPEGTRVVLHFPGNEGASARQAFLPDPVFPMDEPTLPAELPMPGEGQPVVARDGGKLLPDPPL